MGFLSGLASAAIGAGGQIAGSIMGAAQTKEAQKRAYNLQKKYDSWYVDNVYPEYQAADYRYSQRYAENSAKWEVEGLKNAGLNPLLAVSNGLSGAGVSYSAPSASGGSVGDGPTLRGPDIRADLAESIRDFASADLSDTQAKVAKDTASSLVSSAKADADYKEANVGIAKATKDKIDAERRQIEANTARTDLETKKLDESGGLKSPLMHDINILRKHHEPSIMRNLAETYSPSSAKSIWRNLSLGMRRGSSRSSSAKDDMLQRRRIDRNTELLKHGGQSGSMRLYTR